LTKQRQTRASSSAAPRFRYRALGATVVLGVASVLASAPAPARAAGRAAAAATGGADDPAVVELVVELLAAGTTPQRTVAALAALTRFADPRALEVVVLYAGHRRPEVRREAVKALAALPDPRALAPLLERLGDESPEVRAEAATALAVRREARAVPRLVRLVRRGDLGAATPLGRLATPETIGELCELQGGVNEAVLATALGTAVQRNDINDGLRVEALRTIAKLHGVEATAALADYLASIPPRDNRGSKREAQRLLDERGGDR